jgi:hypothetical protein
LSRNTIRLAPFFDRGTMQSKFLAISAVLITLLAGCSTVAEKTNMMSDADVKAKVAGTLGYSAETMTLLNRRTDGTNTYVTVRAADKKEFACTVNGGNLLSMGITNPPDCRAR